MRRCENIPADARKLEQESDRHLEEHGFIQHRKGRKNEAEIFRTVDAGYVLRTIKKCKAKIARAAWLNPYYGWLWVYLQDVHRR